MSVLILNAKVFHLFGAVTRYSTHTVTPNTLRNNCPYKNINYHLVLTAHTWLTSLVYGFCRRLKAGYATLKVL